MARKTEVIETFSDDIDGSTKDVETVSFALDGTSYEIDLGPKNAKAIREQIGEWTSYARKARKTAGSGRRRTSSSSSGSDAATIRAWAAEHGIEVPARGRIPGSVVEQYNAAQ